MESYLKLKKKVSYRRAQAAFKLVPTMKKDLNWAKTLSGVLNSITSLNKIKSNKILNFVFASG